jgi:hypothetical protein
MINAKTARAFVFAAALVSGPVLANNQNFMSLFFTSGNDRGVTVVSNPPNPSANIVQLSMLHNTAWVDSQPLETKTAIQKAIVLSQKDVYDEVVSIQNSLSGAKVLLFTEGLTPEMKPFVDLVVRFCNTNQKSPRAFLDEVGKTELTEELARYVAAKRTNSLSQEVENSLLLKAGAEWKATCDGKALMQPLETRPLIMLGVSASNRMRELRQQTLLAVKTELGDSWNLFQADLTQQFAVSGRTSVQYSNLAAHTTSSKVREILSGSVSEFQALEKVLYEDRERAIVAVLQRSQGNNVDGAKVSVITLGSNHDLGDVIENDVAYAKIATDTTQ